MSNQVVRQRALLPFAFLGLLMIMLATSIPALRSPLASTLLAVTVLLLLLRPIEREVRSSSQFRTRVILIGNNRTIAEKFIELIEANPKSGYSIIGLVEETPSRQPYYGAHLVLGTLDELDTIVRAVRPDRIVLALSDRRGRMPAAELLDFQLNGIAVEEVVDACERVSGKLAIETITPGQLISSQGLRKSLALKTAQRVLSFTAAAILIVVLAPLFGLIALAIKLDSRGPVLFRQLRLGKGMRPFHLIKFRTMKPIARPPSEWVQDNVTRVTRLGRWLRRLRFDELPQLINVIRGEMNLIGPRPHPVSHLQLFREAIPYYKLRCSVLPGISGWAQVRYHYANNLEQETEKMRYDLYYIKHMSLWMDLRILFETFMILISSLTSWQGEEVPINQQPFRSALFSMESRSKSRVPARLPQIRPADDADSRSTNLMEARRL